MLGGMVRNLFYIGIIVSASGLIGPPFALAAGLAFVLTTVHHFHVESRQLSRFLLQAAVVCLGFGMNLKEVVHAGRGSSTRRSALRLLSAWACCLARC